jgi:hypothetical protein
MLEAPWCKADILAGAALVAWRAKKDQRTIEHLEKACKRRSSFGQGSGQGVPDGNRARSKEGSREERKEGKEKKGK